ncbi:unnamed protein product, partial [Vitis vinifera]
MRSIKKNTKIIKRRNLSIFLRKQNLINFIPPFKLHLNLVLKHIIQKSSVEEELRPQPEPSWHPP